MNEQPLNLRASLQEIWRRRLLVIVVAALCGLGGMTLGFLKPADQTAVALILLPPSGIHFRCAGEHYPDRCHHRRKLARPGRGWCQVFAATRSNRSQKSRDGHRT